MYGEHVLEAGEVIPHDPAGYLQDLKEKVPALDDLVEMYVVESLQCFLRGTYIASTVMLGVASEAAMIKLIETAGGAIADEGERVQYERDTSTWIIARKYDVLKGKLPSFRTRLPRELGQDLEVMLDGCFTLIRNYRNEAGHPTGRVVEREVCFANLQLFKVYCERVYELSNWLGSNSI